MYKKGKKDGERVFVDSKGKNFKGVLENRKRVIKTNTLYKDWLPGKWKGKGYQGNGDTWRVVLEYNNKDDIKISFPNFPCNGTWYFYQENAKQIFFQGKNKWLPLI